jgi:glycosyltransferase involved in cell wall biosynthesis
MTAIRAKRGAAGAEPALLSLGRLVPQKDHATLLSALAMLRDRPWRLAIVGDGPLSGDLRTQAAALGIADRVTFAGFTTDPLPQLARADLLVVSSRWEGLPAVPIEALACGSAVVATDCAPGLTEMLASAGLAAASPVGDAAALAQAISGELDRRRDRAQLTAAAAPYALAASIDDHVRLFAPLLSDPKVVRQL